MNLQEKLGHVQKIFMEYSSVDIEEDLTALKNRLDQGDSEFLSLRYEATSYRLAMTCLPAEGAKWNSFYQEIGIPHAGQIHVGLGWAMAKMNVSIAELEKLVDVELRDFTINGCGFFYGMFKKHASIEAKNYPPIIEGYTSDFDKGLGRSMWYSSRGEISGVAELIASFSKERQSDLWCGIGTAATYVGGLNEEQVDELWTAGVGFENDLNTGFQAALDSREKAGTLVLLTAQRMATFITSRG